MSRDVDLPILVDGLKSTGRIEIIVGNGGWLFKTAAKYVGENFQVLSF